jgi:hypothetical protein
MSYLLVHTGCAQLDTHMLYHRRDHPPLALVCMFIGQLLKCFFPLPP